MLDAIDREDRWNTGRPEARASAVTLLAVALLLAGCGSLTSTTPSQTHASPPATAATHPKQGAPRALESPGVKKAFSGYVACMHAHGIAHVPARTSPLRLLLKAAEASSAKYRSANLICYMTLAAADQAIAGKMPAEGPR